MEMSWGLCSTLVVGRYHWSYRSKIKGEVEGPRWAPCQLKEPFKGPKLKQGSCMEERKRPIFSPMRGHSGKSMIFAINQLEKNEFVARPEDPQQTIKKSWLKMTRFQILPNRVPAAASKSLQKQRIKAGGCGHALSRWQSRKPDLRCPQFWLPLGRFASAHSLFTQVNIGLKLNRT